MHAKREREARTEAPNCMKFVVILASMVDRFESGVHRNPEPPDVTSHRK
jgi:hypothetical protein